MENISLKGDNKNLKTKSNCPCPPHSNKKLTLSDFDN